ncbi:hypothetical protein LCI18_011950 [Fusarium solani-melongenae]|uniref:Uncharacterized protein n=1 Tax=Fusarium solani subsp. cucurbitae TaxID=2747967 RepID=A0ACD3ZIF3_FUSSC|nr:hypothetical protein LCI18_011950 [Fusarium solani-melongenae]
MRFLFFATLVTSALAIDSLTELMDQLPKCSIECLTNALSEQGCSLTDVQCACSNVQAIVESASPCLIIAGCALDELSKASTSVAEICSGQITGTPTPAASSAPTSTAADTVETNGQPSTFGKGSMWTGALAAAAVALL